VPLEESVAERSVVESAALREKNETQAEDDKTESVGMGCSRAGASSWGGLKGKFAREATGRQW